MCHKDKLDNTSLSAYASHWRCACSNDEITTALQSAYLAHPAALLRLPAAVPLADGGCLPDDVGYHGADAAYSPAHPPHRRPGHRRPRPSPLDSLGPRPAGADRCQERADLP